MSGHAHGWELLGWWVFIVASLLTTAWLLRPSRQRALAKFRAQVAQDIRSIAEDPRLFEDEEEQEEQKECR